MATLSFAIDMGDSDCDSSYSQDTCSQLDEERMRTLFQSCDKNGDGFIDSVDLNTICKQLHLEHSLDELMQGLGADEQGKISYDEFLKRRRALKAEIDALRNSIDPAMSEYQPPRSDTSAEGISGIWEYDSGTSDLSPEPNSLQRLVEAAGGSVTSGNAASLLHLANKLHLAALGSLHAQIADLTYKLATTTEERDLLKIKLMKVEAVSNTDATKEEYEERITELHSIIAELIGKMNFRSNVVIEEEELSDAGQSLDEMCSDELNVTGSIEDEEDEKGAGAACCQVLKQIPPDENTKKNEWCGPESNNLDSKEKFEYPKEEEAKILDSGPKIEDLLHGEILISKMDRLHADNIVLQLSLLRVKEENEKLMLLVGQYESNVTALRLALNFGDRIVDTFRELEMVMSSESEVSTPLEIELKEHIDQLTINKINVEGTVIEFQSYSIESSALPHVNPNLSTRFDLEMAVLVQELMKAREDRQLMSKKLALLERERDNFQLQLIQMEGWKQQFLLSIPSWKQINEEGADREIVKRDNLLKEKLAKSLEKQVELTVQLKSINAALMESLEKCKKKSRTRIQELEEKLMFINQEHKNQVTELQQKIEQLQLSNELQ